MSTILAEGPRWYEGGCGNKPPFRVVRTARGCVVETSLRTDAMGTRIWEELDIHGEALRIVYDLATSVLDLRERLAALQRERGT